MADKIQPVSKPVPAPDGLRNPSSYRTLTTPEPVFGRYFGSGKEGKDAVGSGNLMGKTGKSR
jgi:hypothetical protein